MSDLEKLLGQFPTLEAPSDLWNRVRAGKRPRRRFVREGFMMTAAAGLLIWLGYTLTWSPGGTPGGSQEGDGWMEREPALGDLPEEEKTVIDALIADLGTGQPSRREAASKLLEGRLETAIPLLRQAARSESADLRASASLLIRRWEASRAETPLRNLLAEARKEAAPKEEWKAIAERAARGSVPAANEVRAIGWPAAPLLADLGARGTGSEQLRIRCLLREILLPRLHKSRTVKLLRRKQGEGYGESVYSFRHATGDAEECKNMVDVIYNNCGLLHFTPYGGTQSFLADAGKASLDQVTDLPKAGWRQANCLFPQEGHVYVLEIREGGESYTYRFRPKTLDEAAIELEWSGIGDQRKPPEINPLQGKAGTFNSCGGRHSEY